MTNIHPISRQRIVRDRRNTDIILPIQGTEGISQEQIPVIGGFQDFTGSGGVSTKSLMFFPLPDELWGTDVWVEGIRKKELGVLGERKRNIRLRQRQQYIEFNE